MTKLSAKFERLDRSLLNMVKRGFVDMSNGAGPGPVAGGGMLTQAQAAPMGPPGGDPSQMGAPAGGQPMDPTMMGGDPAMMGGDPAAMGGAPVDPSQMSGAPADSGGGDPNAAGGIPPEIMDALTQAQGAGSAPAASQIQMTVPDLISLIQALQAGGTSKPKAKPAGDAGGASAGSSTDAKLDQILQALGGNMMGGAGAPPAGGQPPPQQ